MSIPHRAGERRKAAAVSVGRITGAMSRAAGGGGTTLPGKVALRLAPDLLRTLSVGRPVVVVSGTNGKTTTTRLLAAAVAERGQVVSNSSGANLLSGLASALLDSHADRSTTAVLEVDEFVLPAAVRDLEPGVAVLLNLSRDQLDRGGEVASHVDRWGHALRRAPRMVVVANADDPLVCAAVLFARPTADRVVWVGAGSTWRHDAPLCPRCHAPWSVVGTSGWGCPTCGFCRPEVSWSVEGRTLVTDAGESVPVDLALPGRANLANAAMAVAAAASVAIPARVAVAAARTVEDVGGRYQRLGYQGRSVHLLLSKNPAGWLEVLDQLQGRDTPVVLAVNARTADGTDLSWLWDVPFERLRGRCVAAAGERAADVSLRLRYADVRHVEEPDPLQAVLRLPGPEAEVVANYTAFRSIRDRLPADAPARPLPPPASVRA